MSQLLLCLTHLCPPDTTSGVPSVQTRTFNLASRRAPGSPTECGNCRFLVFLRLRPGHAGTARHQEDADSFWSLWQKFTHATPLGKSSLQALQCCLTLNKAFSSVFFLKTTSSRHSETDIDVHIFSPCSPPKISPHPHVTD